MTQVNASTQYNSHVPVALEKSDQVATWNMACTLLVLAILVLPQALRAQYQLDPSEQAGVTALGSYHESNIDAVNMMNGRVAHPFPAHEVGAPPFASS